MTNDAAKSFVAAYTEAGNKNDIPTMNDMMQTLNLNYGDNDGLALTQLLENGLTYGAKVSYIFGDGELAQEPVMTGTLPGVPENYAKLTTKSQNSANPQKNL